MKGAFYQNPNKQQEYYNDNNLSFESDFTFENVEGGTDYINISEAILQEPKILVETEFLKKYVSNVAASMLRTRVGNFFISTKSTFFKSQMAEYFAKQIFEHEILGNYVVIKPKIQLEDTLFDVDYDTIFQDLFCEGYTKVILYIDNFDEKCDEAEIPIFFNLIKRLKNDFEFEDIKILATVNSSELKFDECLYYESEFKFDFVQLFEPNVEEFKELLNPFVNELGKKYGIKLSPAMYEYYNLMYIVQCIGNYDMSCYLDVLDYVFSIAKLNNRKNITRSDINDAFGLFVFDDTKFTSKELKEICYHEAGHYIVGRMLFEEEYSFTAIACIPRRDSSIGITIAFIKILDRILNADILKKYLAYTLGGEIAEELIGVPINTGAEADFKDAMEMASDWVLKSGTSAELGKYCFYTKKRISNKKLEIAEDLAKDIIMDAAKLCESVLKENKAFLDELAEELFKKRLLSKHDVEKIYKKHSQKNSK